MKKKSSTYKKQKNTSWHLWTSFFCDSLLIGQKKTCILQRIIQWTFPLILLAIYKAVLKKTVKMWKVYIWQWGTQSDGNTLLFGSVKLKYIFGTILYMTHIILIYKNISLYFNIFFKFYKIKQLILIYIYKILTVSNIHQCPVNNIHFTLWYDPDILFYHCLVWTLCYFSADLKHK